jgi:hypothetical protein
MPRRTRIATSYPRNKVLPFLLSPVHRAGLGCNTALSRALKLQVTSVFSASLLCDELSSSPATRHKLANFSTAISINW